MRYLSIIVAAFLIHPATIMAEVKPAAIFSDGMILQRDLHVPVWGTASPGEKVTVLFDGQKIECVADKDGGWMVKLKPSKASVNGKTMTIKGSNTITFDDVLVGEVWLCGGQSNMGGTMKDFHLKVIEEKRSEINFKGYRYFHKKNGWQPINAETYSSLSTVSYFYGIKLYEELNKNGIKVPVGVLPRAHSGSTIQSWLPLSAAEKIKRELKLPELGWDSDTDKPHHMPGHMFNEKLKMAIPYAIRGAIWYQGESNANHHAWHYRHLLPFLIKTWRDLWAERAGLPHRNFSFYYVQVPPQGRNSHWSRLRDSMRRVLATTEHTGMAVFYDYGPEVHPVNKEPVGTRLALWALAKNYGFDDLVYSGPLFSKLSIKGNKAILSFEHVGSGLVSKTGDNKLKFFEIAGREGEYLPADATIKGDTVVVQTKDIAEPVHVRYIFNRVDSEKKDPEMSLYNVEGLPASPFMTDDLIPVPIDKIARRERQKKMKRRQKDAEKAKRKRKQ